MNLTLQATPNRAFRILQLTDIHLMDALTDQRAFADIQKLVLHTQPDLIFLTGDQAMTKDSVERYRDLASQMTRFGIPWTFVFGNHDPEHGVAYADLIAAAKTSPTLLFDCADTEGKSDFVIRVEGQAEPFLVFGFDTHNDQMYPIDGALKWGYASFEPRQLQWYEDVLSQAKANDKTMPKSLAFYHIPIPQYRDVPNIFIGEKHEPVSCPPVDTGFFAACLKLQSTIAMFCGHDHLNDYCFDHSGITLAHGRVSGHYDYAMPGFPKGGRVIDYLNGKMTTWIQLYRDIV
ncbi:MAG: metallophosphoesterase [Bacillus subtilis]|nr:metallophosphoesterase [Bacillus subtilis]